MIKLYHFQGSPYGWIARAALAEKRLEYEAVEPRDRDTNPELRRLNPINRTPTIVDGGVPVFESFAILEYLEEKYPEPPLMPKDPGARARARAMALLGYLYIYPEARTIGMQLFDFDNWDRAAQVYPPRRTPDKIDHSIVAPAEERLAQYFRILDDELAKNPWASGKEFGLADIVLTPAAAAWRLRGGPIKELRNVDQWLDACLERPSVRDAAIPVVKRGTPI